MSSAGRERIAAGSSKVARALGPYSRALERGAIGDTIDGRSKTGRLIRSLERQLVQHIGGNPTVVQRMLIDRLIRVRLQLDLLDEKLAKGWTGHDSRTYGALLNACRLISRELGLRPFAEKAATRPPTPAELLAEQESREWP